MKACPDAYHCPVEATIDIVGGKHKVLILWHLSKHGVLRFGELQRLMTQATPKMLTQQLREPMAWCIASCTIRCRRKRNTRSRRAGTVSPLS